MEIKLENVSKSYLRNERKIHIIDNFNKTFEKGKFTVLSGDSGVGKSTLLDIMAGLKLPSEGKVFYDDIDIYKVSDEERATLRRKHLGIVTQNSDLIPYLTLKENMELACDITKSGTIDAKESILEELGLKSLIHEYPSKMSYGEIKRSAIARALIVKPEIILMDEPTANLDEANVVRVLTLLRKFCDDGSTVIITSHEKESFKYSDHIEKLSFAGER